MAERSFAREVEDLKLGDGEVFRGEGILAITKALLQSGVAYVGGYQGAPISHLMDVLADAKDVLEDLGVHFETSASEATAAATLSASVMYPIRGAVTWKSTAGTNVAADALSNLSSGGVTGGALIVIGEDYGEGSSIMQERSSRLRDEIADLADGPASEPADARAHGRGRVRAFRGDEHAGDARGAHSHLPCPRVVSSPRTTRSRVSRCARRWKTRCATSIASCCRPPRSCRRRTSIERRWPAAIEFIKSHKLNETFGPAKGDVGVVMLGGMYNSTMRALQYLGLADAYGESAVPLYVLNVAYPLIEDEIVAFCRASARS